MFALPRVITATGAACLGYTESQVRTELRRERWRQLSTGVFLTRPEQPTRADWAHAGMVLGGPDSALSGRDAVRLRGLGTAWAPDYRVLGAYPNWTPQPGRRRGASSPQRPSVERNGAS